MINEDMIVRNSGEYDPEVVTRLTLQQKGLTEISNLTRCTSLTYLDLSRNAIKTIAGLDELDSLKRLDLSFNKLETIGSSLSANVNLVSLNLRGNYIKEKSELDGLVSLEKLDSLQLQDEAGRDGNPVCKDPQYVSYVQRTLTSLTLLDGGHLLLVDCVADMNERMEAMKPDESGCKTPPSEPWFAAEDVASFDGTGSENAEKNANFAQVDDTVQAIDDVLKFEGTRLLKEASSVLSKAQRL